MPIDPLSVAQAYQQTARSGSSGGVAGGDSMDFAGLVQQAIREAGQTSLVAEQQAMNVASGQGDIVDVVTAIAAAETQLETVIAVRDQVIQAYQEILRMPI
jgi:flagellar hook-basal body complex protein FliE